MDRKVKIVKKRTKFHRKHKNKDAKHSDNKNKDIKFNLATFQQKHYMEMYNQCKNQHFNTIEDLRLQAVEFLEHRNIKDSIQTFRNNLLQLTNYIDQKLPSKKLPIFIFVDELDRCRPSYAIELLENIKHLFGVRGVYFVVATDSEQLSHSIKSVYGSGFDSERYLKRFFDQEYTFLNPDDLSFAGFLFEKYKLNIESDSFFSPIHEDFCKGYHPNVFLFYLLSSYFQLSLRDQEQICLMLNAVSISHGGKVFHLAYLLFLMMLRKVSNKAFEMYCKNAKSYTGTNSLDQFCTTIYKDLNIAFERRVSFGDIYQAFGKPAEERTPKISSLISLYMRLLSPEVPIKDILENYQNTKAFERVIVKLKDEFMLPNHRLNQPLAHNLDTYPLIVMQAGQLS